MAYLKIPLPLPLVCVALGLLAFPRAGKCQDAGNALDTLSIGDGGSEKAHRMAIDHASPIKGGFDEPALQLLPLDPASADGGSMSFTMKVDPAKQNYVTVRLWGSDKGAESGLLVLWAEGKEVGYRRQSDYDLLNECDDEPEAPGRFFYETRPLPPWMTKGKTTIDLKISVIGSIWAYAPNYSQYQKPLEHPSRGIYRVYTHTDMRFQPAPDEKQGSAPVVKLRTAPGAEVIEKSRQIVNARLTGLLKFSKVDGSDNIALLAEAYRTKWTPAYNNPAALQRVALEADNLANKFVSDPKYDGGWLGCGVIGSAIAGLQPDIAKLLDQPFPGGAPGSTRRAVWTQALIQSRDYWRTHRRNYTNQSMLVDWGIYAANKGLELIAPDKALPESRALSYVRQAVGLEPWMDSDDPKTDKPTNPYDGKYSLVTAESLSRELGWVGSYGETIIHIAGDLCRITGNEDIRRQLMKLQDARLVFRYPGYDKDGWYTMKLASEVDNRVSHFPYPGAAYSVAAVRESWGLDAAALLSDDPQAAGAGERLLKDGEYFPYVEERLKDTDTRGMMRNVDEYEKVKSLPPASFHFPMEDGQPDFVFSDEQDAVLAIKHGDTRLFVNLYFRAENAVNNVAKIMEINPSTVRLVTARTNTQVIGSGDFYTRPDYIDWIRNDRLKPPGGNLHQAWAGEKLPISARPDGVISPKYGDFGPYVGRAAFYWVTYGDFLIGLNTTGKNTYDLPVPRAGGTYLDLVSNKEVQSLNGVVKVPPLSTVVLYLGK